MQVNQLRDDAMRRGAGASVCHWGSRYEIGYFYSLVPEYEAHALRLYLKCADSAAIQPVLVLKPDCPDEFHVT